MYHELSKMPSLTAAKLAEIIGVSKPTVERAIKSLKEKGFIVREGSFKSGKWIILK